MSDDATTERRFARMTGLNERRVGEKVFVLDDKTQLHTLDNPSAVFLWDAIPESKAGVITVQGLAAALCGAFEVAEPIAKADSQAFVDQLLALSLLVEVQS